MKLSKRLKLSLIASVLLPFSLHGQVSILELDQEENIFNHVSEGDYGTATGIGGTSVNTAVNGQFKSLYPFASSAPVTGVDNPISAPSSASFKLGPIRIGATFFGRSSSYQFGEILPLPITDSDGEELVGVNPSDYWTPRPYLDSDSLGIVWDERLGYAKATSDKNVAFELTWQKSVPEIGRPSDYDTDPTKYTVESTAYYLLYTHTHASATRGQGILPPDVDGTVVQVLVDGAEYWNAKPYDLRSTERYHFSESANAVFATQPGPVTVVWRELLPTATSTTDLDTAGLDYVVDGGLTYRLYSKKYIISGAPVKPARTIYWTGGAYNGVSVMIPETRVTEVQIVYNSDVPKEVPVSEGTPLNEGSGVGTEVTGGGQANSAITSTFWYSPSDKSLKALNREGRLFLEYLGTANPETGIPEHLGFEVVDIIKRATPKDETTELGEPLPVETTEVVVDGSVVTERLAPQLANLQEGDKFVFRHVTSADAGSASDLTNAVLYARRETVNVNDLVIWWLEEGVQGIRWPKEYVRYDLKWPTDVSKYNHYVRPLVVSEIEAMETAVQLNGEEVPLIDYQDPLDVDRAKISPGFKFYTWLSEAYPAHRTLLRFQSGNDIRFERVFSWLDGSLMPVDVNGDFAAGILENSIATQLDSYDSGGKTFRWEDAAKVANTIEKTVYVGDRLQVPATSLGFGENAVYWAGYVNLAKGDSIHPTAYVDPFTSGFEEANFGAIIPVNAIPGDNELEVMWFRRSDGDETDGFSAHYWPSTLARYTIEWPTAPAKIVLASNDGSGPLPSLLAKGKIYYENDKTKVGYNPNEEHALMQGGQAFALRDDLNVMTNDSGEYSSDSYVLLEYDDADTRVSMIPLKVLREDILAGDVFNYEVEAGTVLQAPMPLPLLELPLSEAADSEGFNVTKEANWIQLQSSDLLDPVEDQLWRFVSKTRPVLVNGSIYNLQSPDLLESKGLYVFGSSHYSNTIDGFISETAVDLESKSGGNDYFNGYEYTVEEDQEPHASFKVTDGNTDVGELVVGEDQFLYVPSLSTSLTLRVVSNEKINGEDIITFEVPSSHYTLKYWDGSESSPRTEEQLLEYYEETAQYEREGVEDSGPRKYPEYLDYVDVQTIRYEFEDILFKDMVALDSDASLVDGDFDDWYVSASPLVAEDLILNDYRSKFTYQDRKGNLWVYRGPHDNSGPTYDNAFDVQFYYKTLPGFYFPEKTMQPAVGTIEPYLRAKGGDGDYIDETSGQEEPALAIKYQPYWPSGTPVLFTGETLTNPKRGLPAVRGQISAQIVYQQSERSENTGTSSVMLHDPTRDKEYYLSPETLNKIPGSAVIESYLGKLYFSLLPPHLGERFFYDGSRGENGALVYRGKFVDEVLGEDYLLLNVLSESDKTKIKDLVVTGDEDKSAWDFAIDGLATTLETFIEDAFKPGTYSPNVALNEEIGAGALADIGDEDIAVDSYALSAAGPGSGYVTMIFGNGEAFTPVGDPVVMQILQVSDDLYRGEVKPVLSSNPLNEMLTMQQISDFAGAVDEYEFEWMIASPVDGLPPVVSESERILLLGDDSWSHLRFPTDFDSGKSMADLAAGRLTVLASGAIVPNETVPYTAVVENEGSGEFEFTATEAALVEAKDIFVMRNEFDEEIVLRRTANSTASVLSLEALEVGASGFVPVSLEEAGSFDNPSSIVYRSFTTESDLDAAGLFLSLDLDDELAVRVYVNNVEVVRANLPQVVTPDPETQVSTTSNPNSSTTGPPTGFLPLARVYAVSPSILNLGTLNADELTHEVVAELYSEAAAGASLAFNLRIEAYERIDKTADNWLALSAAKYPDGVRTILGDTADVRALSDNYLIMRYRPVLNEDASARAGGDTTGYSQWTTPALAEGWIKRVLAGINPFNQRVTNLFSNAVDADASVLTEAGPRWEGDVALNLSTVNDYGLIEIYETVLNRGRMLSIDSGIDFGPANDALLLVTGYLNDLYALLGDEAKADALNPTIGIGTADSTYGDIATSMFSFGGQVATLLEEELALWRGRSDFLQPGVEVTPVYNRLVWNYTRGIDAGEVIYALNYNIQENQTGDLDGAVTAADAAVMYPQGHGDAYGHYLMAIKNYYKLFMDDDFTWVPRIEAVNVLGVPVSVDYQDERKFAASAVEVAKAGQQILELTWRQDYENVAEKGWEHFSDTRTNTRRTVPSTRYWGVDHWASRTQQGTYLNWVVGNSMLPDVDPDPDHEGIQRVDRQTVLELQELTFAGEATLASSDNAEAGLNPLGLEKDSIVFDLNTSGFGLGETSHFEQIFERAKGALNNAVIAFDGAKDVTRLMRSEEDSLNEFQAKIDTQEQAYEDQLIEIYGTPFADDIGPGKTYASGYAGPDLVHHVYVKDATLDIKGFEKEEDIPYELEFFVADNEAEDFWLSSGLNERLTSRQDPDSSDPDDGAMYVLEYNLSPNGFLEKPDNWTGSRQYEGKLQLAINTIATKRDAAYGALELYEYYTYALNRQLEIFEAKVKTMKDIKGFKEDMRELRTIAKATEAGTELVTRALQIAIDDIDIVANITETAIPQNITLGMASGGDVLSSGRVTVKTINSTATKVLKTLKIAAEIGGRAAVVVLEYNANTINFEEIVPAEILQIEKESVYAVDEALGNLTAYVFPLNRSLQELQRAQMEYSALMAQGQMIQAEREVFRKRSAVVVQGYRTRNAAFRLFRNEKLERYKSLFDLAARYSFLAAQAFDYETGLLGSEEGQDFIARIIQARALGVVQDGEPQFGGSNAGDPGLSSVLAEMAGDWSVLKSRLGFNNPDIYGTTFSLRTENFRILPGSEGADKWRDVLEAGRVSDLLADPDVSRYAMQIDTGDGLPVPGIVIEFSTSITNEDNFFGNNLAGGDHTFSPTSFATKIFSSGIVLGGYVGMDDPTLNSGATSGATSPSDPDLAFLGDDILSATPYIYLIPVGTDIMRTPPLGDESVLRGWNVQDVTIPLPFNIGASEHSSKDFYRSRDSLSEPLFSLRKHQAFRPVSTSDVYLGDSGRLFPSEFTNNRLIGRSVWNTRWKIVIPGRTLLNDADEGLARFIDTVEDIKLHLETYSYSGN
ncbi:MAG: hypothetical protein ACI92G_001752 [Candidatus Pelagisphaera sp.]|jgi:hypothetical protein